MTDQLLSEESSVSQVKEAQESIRDIPTLRRQAPTPEGRGSVEQNQLLDVERKARIAAERTSLLKDQFLANLSHELRTPINAILGWSQLVKPDESSESDIAEALTVIQRNARLQAHLIDDLLDISRVISGHMRLDIQRVELTHVIQNALESLRPAANAKNIRLDTMLDPLAGPVTGDPARLQQIIWNLLSNALKFTGQNGKVQIILERVNSHLELSVSDNGEGISPEFLPYVFDRLAQADTLPARRYGGLGLGLAIVKSLAELHGGSVRVKSAGLGRGSTFTLSLPVSILQIKPGGNGHETSASDEIRSPPYAPHLAGARVLVVDNDADAVELVRRALKSSGAEVTTAKGGAEALTLLLRDSADVVLADIGMPDMDGYEFISLLRRSETSPMRNVPAVAMTALARSEDRRQAMLAGFDLHMAKPIELAELVAVIGRLARCI